MPSPLVSDRIEIVSSGSRFCRSARAIRCLSTARCWARGGRSDTPAFPRPRAGPFIPVDVHGLVDERLGGDQGEVELRMHFDFRRGLGRRGRPALDVAQRVALFVRLQELVDVRPLARPRDAAQQQRAVVGPVEVLVEVTGDRDEAAIRRPCRLRSCARRSRSAAGCRRR